MLFAINRKYWNIEEGTIGWNEVTAFIVIPTIIKGISTNCVMGLLHLNLRKKRSRPVPQTGNDHNVIISHNTIKESLQSSSSNNIRLKLNRQLMEQLCYLRLIRDLVRSASLAVPLTLFTLLRTKTFFTRAVGLHRTVCILLQIAVLFAVQKSGLMLTKGGSVQFFVGS